MTIFLGRSTFEPFRLCLLLLLCLTSRNNYSEGVAFSNAGDDDAPTSAAAGNNNDQPVIPETEIISTIEGIKRRIEFDLTSDATVVKSGLPSPLQSTMNELNTKIGNLQTLMKQLEELYVQYNSHQNETMKLIHEANELQLENLIQRLDNTLEKEVSLRERMGGEMSMLIDQQDGSNVVEAGVGPDVTMATLQQRLDVELILEDSEREIASWILQVAKDELDSFKRTKIASSSAAAAASAAVKRQVGSTTSKGIKDDSCPTTSQILEQVQLSLNRYADDGVGIVDYANHGGRIVSMMTSKTYVPPSKPSQKLGSVWFRSFIPEDWERYLLPDGWEDWNVGIPDYVYHSLGLSGGSVVPPDAVLHPKVLPGSCWPMSGSTGQVTLKLERPIVIEALTVDHVSSAIIPDGKHMSAPKRIIVVAFPPCDSERSDASCGSIGFDVTQEFEVARITYDVEADISVQTFDSHYGLALKNLSDNAQLKEGETDDGGVGVVAGDEDDSASCSTGTATLCSTPPRIPAAGVTFKVLENWGEPGPSSGIHGFRTLHVFQTIKE